MDHGERHLFPSSIGCSLVIYIHINILQSLLSLLSKSNKTVSGENCFPRTQLDSRGLDAYEQGHGLMRTEVKGC